MSAALCLARIVEVYESESPIGFCIYCGDEAFNVEPESRALLCESCGAEGVYGVDAILQGI